MILPAPTAPRCGPASDEAMAHLHTLADALGVSTSYTDGLGRSVSASPETLVRVCAALGAPVAHPGDASDALRAVREGSPPRLVPPVLVAWNGWLGPVPVAGGEPAAARLALENGPVGVFTAREGVVHIRPHLPWGYHILTVESGGREESCTIISTPIRAWRRPGSRHSWGVGIHLGALRSERSRSVGDLTDLAALSRWVGGMGGDLVTVLPLLPTFNTPPAEPSPYSPVSRLFWSELVLDVGPAAAASDALQMARGRVDVTLADAEVRGALAGHSRPDPSTLDPELVRYARFRGGQLRLGRNWREWPEGARDGALHPSQVDPDEERFHLVAQLLARQQLEQLGGDMNARGVRLGLDLAVGVHPDGYDVWSRQHLFAAGMSVGAPPDPGFPSGQDWGFPPILPQASRLEGHRYLAASIAHQAAVSGVLRVDHVMALARLYWIPLGLGLDEGTYVSYPAEELFAVLILESHRNRCEIVGENLGTVPSEIGEALPRHGIWGMFMAQFEASSPHPAPPTATQAALISSHDTPTLAGWVAGLDVAERVRCGLLAPEAAPDVLEARARDVEHLARAVGVTWPVPSPATRRSDGEGQENDPSAYPPEPGVAADGSLDDLLDGVLHWLGASESPLVVPWLEDLWLEAEQVNLPGTRSADRPNWQRPMGVTLEGVMADPDVARRLQRLHALRTGTAPGGP